MRAVKSADLCQGQHHHFLRYHQVPPDARHEAHITTSYPLPAGCTAENARSALNYLVCRHEVLRTVYDLRAEPWPRQRVMAPAPLRIREIAADDTASAEVIRRLVQDPFDISREWPIRVCLVTARGVLKRLHLIFNHLAFDDIGLDILSADLDALLAARTAGRPVTLPPVEYQPVDLARYEASRPAAAVEEDLEHWRAEVGRVPADVYARRRRGDSTVAHSASFTAPGLLSAARAIAARHRVWPSAVHLAAYAVTMGAYTGSPLVTHRLYTSQRDASGFRSVLTCMSYPTLVTADLSGDPAFSEVVRRAAETVRLSMARAHVPHDRIVEMIAREGVRRGRELRVSSEVNFLDNAPRSCRTGRDRFVWNAAPAEWAYAGSDIYLRIYEWSDGITLALQARDEVMDSSAVQLFLRGYARLIQAHWEGADLRVSHAVDLFGFQVRQEPEPRPDPVVVHPSAPEEGAERALAEAVATANGLADVDMTLSYVLAGGRALLLPHVLAVLRDSGWDGLVLRDLLGIRPLRAVAAMMRRTPRTGAR